jgi:hypothetical protein
MALSYVTARHSPDVTQTYDSSVTSGFDQEPRKFFCLLCSAQPTCCKCSTVSASLRIRTTHEFRRRAVCCMKLQGCERESSFPLMSYSHLVETVKAAGLIPVDVIRRLPRVREANQQRRYLIRFSHRTKQSVRLGRDLGSFLDNESVSHTSEL